MAVPQRIKQGLPILPRTILGTTYTWAGGADTIAGDVVSIGKKAMNVNLLTYHQVIFPQIQLMQSMVLSFMQRWLKLKNPLFLG